MSRTRQPYRNGKVHILAEQCATCIFRPGNLMDLHKGRVKQMVESSLKRDSAIICHETLHRSDPHGKDGKALCKGFVDRYASSVFPLRLAQAMDKIEWVN